MAVDDFFVHVDDYGAVPDSTWQGGGTDSTAAIQAAINDCVPGGANSGKIVLVGPGAYKTTGPLNLRTGSEVRSLSEVRSVAVGNDAVPFGTRLDFYGGPTDNCVQAIGTPAGSVSRFAVAGLKIVDRRTVRSGGWGFYFEKCVNQVVVRHMDINGFPAPGGGIRVTAQSGNASDCVRIEDVWLTKAQVGDWPGHGIWCDHIDNQLDISDIKADTGTSSQVAVVRVGNSVAAATIRNVKHENTGGAPTILVNSLTSSLTIDGVVSRMGLVGPVVVLDGANGGGVQIRNIARQYYGPLIKLTDGQVIAGNKFGFWCGSAAAFGDIDLFGKAKIAGRVSSLGFFGATGTTKRTLYGNIGSDPGAVLKGLIGVLAAHGLLVDSTVM